MDEESFFPPFFNDDPFEAFEFGRFEDREEELQPQTLDFAKLHNEAQLNEVAQEIQQVQIPPAVPGQQEEEASELVQQSSELGISPALLQKIRDSFRKEEEERLVKILDGVAAYKDVYEQMNLKNLKKYQQAVKKQEKKGEGTLNKKFDSKSGSFVDKSCDNLAHLLLSQGTLFSKMDAELELFEESPRQHVIVLGQSQQSQDQIEQGGPDSRRKAAEEEQKDEDVVEVQERPKKSLIEEAKVVQHVSSSSEEEEFDEFIGHLIEAAKAKERVKARSKLVGSNLSYGKHSLRSEEDSVISKCKAQDLKKIEQSLCYDFREDFQTATKSTRDLSLRNSNRGHSNVSNEQTLEICLSEEEVEEEAEQNFQNDLEETGNEPGDQVLQTCDSTRMSGDHDQIQEELGEGPEIIEIIEASTGKKPLLQATCQLESSQEQPSCASWKLSLIDEATASHEQISEPSNKFQKLRKRLFDRFSQEKQAPEEGRQVKRRKLVEAACLPSLLCEPERHCLVLE